MSETPIQTRTIDPYSSYNSNVVNQLTRMITRGKNCLHGIHAIDVVIDSTSTDTEIVVLPGEGFKDDVILQINERKTVDMSDMQYYLNHLNPFNEAGYYYVCLEYTYAKSRPAPEAKIRLLKPSQTHLYNPDNSPFLLLKVVNIIFNGSTFEVDKLFDFDPSNPTITKIYSQLYTGVESSLPPFEQERDEGRLVYVKDIDEMFFGIENRWESFNAVRANTNTSLCEVGELVYIGDDQFTHPSISTSSDTFADCVVISEGDKGKVRLVGEIEKVKIETGVTISYGDKLYLSGNIAGTITNISTFPISQFIGISVSTVDQTTECDIWFLPNRSANGSGGSDFDNIVDFYQDLLHSSIFERLFIEPFVNNDFIDNAVSNITINGSHGTLTGGTGDVYQTIEIKDPSLVGRVQVAQLTAKLECTGTSFIKWFISNNGTEPLDWEVAELDKLHHFATYRISFSSGSGTFQVGENVLSDTTNKMATISGINGGEILVFADTRLGVDYVNGETITGQTSGATGVVDVIVNRQQPSYNDIRLKIEFEGTAGECIIEDYGILYDQDEDIFNIMPSEIDIQNNIDTLYLDIYQFPSQDNDGAANRARSIEEDLIDHQNQISLLARAPMFVTTPDSTPDVAANPSIVRIDYASPLTITDFDNGFIGQDLTIIFTNSNISIEHNSNIHLYGAASFNGQDEYVLKLVHNGTRWIEESRSVSTYT